MMSSTALKRDNASFTNSSDTNSVSFHSRYQPLMTKQELENGRLVKTIDIDLKREASAYRMNVSFERIVVCFWNNNFIVCYNADGSKVWERDVTDQLIDVPYSAVPVGNNHIVVASKSSLAVVDTALPALSQPSARTYTLRCGLCTDHCLCLERIFNRDR